MNDPTPAAVVSDEGAQRALEERRAQVWDRVLAGDLDVTAALGSPDDWELTVGGARFLLHPATAEWLHLDEVHDSWEPTGFRAGEVVFGVSGRLVGARRVTPRS